MLFAACASLAISVFPSGPEGVCTPPKPAFAAAAGSPIRVGPMPGRPVLADMNGDGRMDIVVACGTCCGSKPSEESGHVLVLLNDGAGRFTESTDKRLKVGPSVRKIAVADVNGDKAPDVLGVEHDTYVVTVLVNDSKGVLSRGGAFVTSKGNRAHTHEVAAADMNEDGFVDVLTTNANDDTVSVMLGNGRGEFAAAPGSPFGTGRHPYDSIAIADFDGDGRDDVAVPLLQAGKIGTLRCESSGALTEGEKLSVGERPGYVVAADVNKDGVADLIGTHDDEGIVDVFLGGAKSAFRKAEGSPFRFTTPVWGVAVADMNSDGSVDLVMGGNRTKVVVALGDGTGKFSEAVSVTVEAGAIPSYVAVGDLNGDGKMDIVTANYDGGTVSVLMGK